MEKSMKGPRGRELDIASIFCNIYAKESNSNLLLEVDSELNLEVSSDK